MKSIKEASINQLLYKQVHFKCDCVIPMDFIGYVRECEIYNNEILFLVEYNGKIIKIGNNHPNMYIEVL